MQNAPTKILKQIAFHGLHLFTFAFFKFLGTFNFRIILDLQKSGKDITKSSCVPLLQFTPLLTTIRDGRFS